jgi:hypothetical protein
LDLAAIIQATSSPRVRPGQEQARRAAAAALAALGLDRWERGGVRLTLTSAPTMEVDGQTLVTGPSRLVVRFARAPRQLQLASVVSLEDERRRRKARAA